MADVRVAGIEGRSDLWASVRVAGLTATAPPSSDSYVRVSGISALSTSDTASIRVAGIAAASTDTPASVRVAGVSLATSTGGAWFTRTLSGWTKGFSAINRL